MMPSAGILLAVAVPHRDGIDSIALQTVVASEVAVEADILEVLALVVAFDAVPWPLLTE